MAAPVWKRLEIWGLGIALVTLLFVLVFVYRDWSRYLAVRAEVTRVESRGDLLSEVFSAAQDLETGQRGFLLTGDPAYLEPYERAKTDIGKSLAQLKQSTELAPSQRERAGRIAALLQQKIAELQRTLELRQTRGLDAARTVVESGRGKALMDAVRMEVAAFRTEDRRGLDALESEEHYYRVRAGVIASGGSILLFLLLAVAAVLVRNRSDARERALASLDSSMRDVERVRDLLEITLRSIGDAVISTDAEGRITFLNPVAQDLTGWDPSCQGRPVDEVFRIINEYTRLPVESPIDKVRRTGMVAGLANHTLLLARDGREISIDDSGAPIRTADGAIVGFVLVFRDIADRRAAENALRESEARFRVLANAAPVLLWFALPDGKVNFLNRQWSEFTGRSLESNRESDWAEALHPEDREAFIQARRAALQKSGPQFLECRLRRADGEYRSVVCAEAPRWNADGRLDGYVAAWFDVTELKQVQRLLEISERRFRSLVEGTSSLVWQTDAGGGLTASLPAWERFTGQESAQYKGFGGLAAIHPDDREHVAAKWREAVLDHESFHLEFRLWSQAGRQYRQVASRGVPLKSPEGEVLEWVGTITDITEQRQFEEKLRQTAKLESLGVLAGGIAHDFNNILVGVLGNASLLEMLLRDPEPREITKEILTSAERAATLTQQMLAYSGRGRFVVEQTDIAAEIRQILTLVKSSIPKHVSVIVEAAPELPQAEVDRAQFQQLVMNLVINGAEAIDGDSGTVTIITRAQAVSADEASSIGDDGLTPGIYVLIEFRDTGSGMDRETQAKIFDPFFTTKFTGRGLGLAAVSGIIKGHRGAITVSSARDAGSVFRVYLPASSVVLSAPAEQTLLNHVESPATVLVVDDEEVVRATARRALTAHGYEVLLAGDGHEAVAVLESRPKTIAVVILDLAMPVMGGEQALPRLRGVDPAVRIVASSGYSEIEAVRRFGASIDGFIQKPYSARALLSAVQSALRKSASPASKAQTSLGQ